MDMSAREFLDSVGRSEATSVAEQAGTNYAYFSQIAYGHRVPSAKMARKLVEASGGRMSLERLLFPPSKAQPAEQAPA